MQLKTKKLVKKNIESISAPFEAPVLSCKQAQGQSRRTRQAAFPKR